MRNQLEYSIVVPTNVNDCIFLFFCRSLLSLLNAAVAFISFVIYFFFVWKSLFPIDFQTNLYFVSLSLQHVLWRRPPITVRRLVAVIAMSLSSIDTARF